MRIPVASIVPKIGQVFEFVRANDFYYVNEVLRIALVL